MSRIARTPLAITNGVQIDLSKIIAVKGVKGELKFFKDSLVEIENKDNVLHFSIAKNLKSSKDKLRAWDMAGTTRSILNNMIIGVSQGYEKNLILVGTGYRAQLQGKKLILNLGFSHEVNYQLPEDISAELKSQTEIIIKGIDKQRVGQIAKEIRNYRPPEPYKGKGVIYKDENVYRKEVKKSAAKK